MIINDMTAHFHVPSQRCSDHHKGAGTISGLRTGRNATLTTCLQRPAAHSDERTPTCSVNTTHCDARCDAPKNGPTAWGMAGLKKPKASGPPQNGTNHDGTGYTMRSARNRSKSAALVRVT